MQRETRMKRELKLLHSDPPPGISCWMVDEKIDRLQASILGADETPYCGGIFKLDITVPERYPFQPPKVQFVTPIYHPNIDNAGRICLDILKMPPKKMCSVSSYCVKKDLHLSLGGWKPSWNISTVLKSVQSLMAEPNPDDPLMAEISEQFKLRRQEFNESARQWTKKHAVATLSKSTSTTKEPEQSQEKQSQTRDFPGMRKCTALADKTNDQKKFKSKREAEGQELTQPKKICKIIID